MSDLGGLAEHGVSVTSFQKRGNNNFSLTELLEKLSKLINVKIIVKQLKYNRK